MIKGYRIKIFPKEKEKEMIHKHFGCSRFVYNWCIDEIDNYYKQTKKMLDSFSLQKRITTLKKQNNFLWLNEVSADTLKRTAHDCVDAYKK